MSDTAFFVPFLRYSTALQHFREKLSLFIVIALRLLENIVASYTYRCGLIRNIIAIYSYGSDNMTKAITCNAVPF
jgi:hypothetical protein